jgi:FkbM family methyltransferase
MIQKIKQIARRLFRGRYSSLNQLDRQLEKYVNYDDGYFVELGANDGVTQSNSLFFEKYRNWRGLLIEPTPHKFIRCRENRSLRTRIYCAACVSFSNDQEFVRIAYSNLMSTSLNLQSDIMDPMSHARLGSQFLPASETVFEFGAIARTLNSILVDAKAPSMIDFLSLDVEGAELEVLQGVNHSQFRFKYILVECRDFVRMSSYLDEKGYQFVAQFSVQDYLFSNQQSAHLVSNARDESKIF